MQLRPPEGVWTMQARRQLLAGGAVAGLLAYLGALRGRTAQAVGASGFEVTHTDDEWRRLLQPAQYKILRQHGTEPPGSSPLDHEFRKGVYSCAGCALPL